MVVTLLTTLSEVELHFFLLVDGQTCTYILSFPHVKIIQHKFMGNMGDIKTSLTKDPSFDEKFVMLIT